MAAVLTQGRSYNLSSATNGNISVVYVKLTDSCLRALDEYHLTKNLKRMATISFSGAIGAVSIPQKDSDLARTFDFSVQKPSNEGSHECLQQFRNNSLTSHGAFSQKLTIHASDDVYQNTIEKMSLAEEKNKKQRAKEIKTSGQTNATLLRKIIRNVKNPQNNFSARNHQTAGNTSSAQRQLASVNAQPKITPASRAASLAAELGGRTSPFPSGTGNQKNGTSSSSSSSSTSKFSLRDRIVHLLALKNYKRPELLLKLHHDGVQEKEKDTINSMLEQVAQLNPRDSSYSLQRHLYLSDVRQDWPLYSDADRQLLNKKLNGLCLNSAVNPRTISPCPSSGSQGSPPRTKRSSEPIDSGTTQKQLCSDAPESGPPPKKVRVAHNAKRDAPRPAAQAPSVQNGALSAADSSRPAAVTSSVPSLNSDMTEGAAVSNDVSSEPDDDDYKRIFTPIQSYEQRCQYKAQFDAEHKEHQEVYNRISQKIAQLNKLQELIVKESEGTSKFESLRNEIFREYFQLKNDDEYMKDRRRYEYLLRKLDYIKKLVYEFDHLHSGRR